MSYMSIIHFYHEVSQLPIGQFWHNIYYLIISLNYLKAIPEKYFNWPIANVAG